MASNNVDSNSATLARRARAFSDSSLAQLRSEPESQTRMEPVGLKMIVSRTFFELQLDEETTDEETTSPYSLTASDASASPCGASWTACESDDETDSIVCLGSDDEDSNACSTVGRTPTQSPFGFNWCSSTVPAEMFRAADIHSDYNGLMHSPTCQSKSSRKRRNKSNLARGWNELTHDVCERDSDARTTLLLKNLPSICTGTGLVEMLHAQGLHGVYDFLYVPSELCSHACFGYAFLNCISNHDALRVKEVLEGFDAWTCGNPVAPMEVCWSEPHQGLHVHIERYRNSPILHESVADDLKPMFFKDGLRAAFPEPTKKVRAPRMSKKRIEDGKMNQH